MSQFPYLGLFLLLILGGLGLPFPEDTTLILCGFLIAHEVVRTVPALALMYAGLLMTDFFLFSVGKRYGRRIVEHHRFQKIISPPKLARLETQFRKRGAVAILFGRHIFGLRAQLFLAAGAMRMPGWKFLLADAVSATFTLLIMTGIGYAGGYGMKTLERDIIRVRDVSFVVAGVLLAAYLIFHSIRSKRKKADSDRRN